MLTAASRDALLSIALLLLLCAQGSVSAAAQPANECSRQFENTIKFVYREHRRWHDAISEARVPPEAVNIYVMVVKYGRDSAINAAVAKRDQCLSNYSEAREIFDLAIIMFANALRALATTQAERIYIEESQVRNGYPLGAPPIFILILQERFKSSSNTDIGGVIGKPVACFVAGC
jgi:hypothetical protein